MYSRAEKNSSNALISLSMAPEHHDQCRLHSPTQRYDTLAGQPQEDLEESESSSDLLGGLSSMPPLRKTDYEKPYLCPNPRCGKRYKRKNGLISHRKRGWVCYFGVIVSRVHLRSSVLYRVKCGELLREARFVCPMLECQKQFGTKSGLAVHRRTRQVIHTYHQNDYASLRCLMVVHLSNSLLDAFIETIWIFTPHPYPSRSVRMKGP